MTAVSTLEPTGENIAAVVETTPPTEEEKVEISQPEPLHEDIPAPEHVPDMTPVIAEMEPASESGLEPVSVLEPTPVPTPSQTVTDPQPGDMVYVPGFGWLECQGPGEIIHDESMYENGNKIGVMG